MLQEEMTNQQQICKRIDSYYHQAYDDIIGIAQLTRFRKEFYNLKKNSPV